MIKLQELMTLIYFNNYNDEYLFSDIKKLCNFSTAQMKKFINDLVEKDLLNKNKDGSLEVSIQGKSILKSKGVLDIKISDLLQDIVTLDFIKDPIDFETIYIPDKFKL